MELVLEKVLHPNQIKLVISAIHRSPITPILASLITSRRNRASIRLASDRVGSLVCRETAVNVENLN